MSKRKENQFLCSSMMLPEHREKLTERYGQEEEAKRPLLPGEQSREEVAHNLSQSLLHRLPVRLLVWDGREIQSLQGTVVAGRPREGQLELRVEKSSRRLPLKDVLDCRLARGALPPEKS